MKRLVQKFRTFGVDSPQQTVRELVFLGAAILLTIAFGFLLML